MQSEAPSAYSSTSRDPEVLFVVALLLLLVGVVVEVLVTVGPAGAEFSAVGAFLLVVGALGVVVALGRRRHR